MRYFIDLFWFFMRNVSSIWWHLDTSKIFFPYNIILFLLDKCHFRLQKEYNSCCCHTQIIFDSLFGKDLNGKLRVYAVQFVHHICLWSSDKVINMMGPVLLSGMTKLINEDKQVCIHLLMTLHDCETWDLRIWCDINLVWPWRGKFFFS